MRSHVVPKCKRRGAKITEIDSGIQNAKVTQGSYGGRDRVWRGRGAIVNNCDVHRGHRPLFESAEDESLRFGGTPVVDTREQYIVSTFHSLGQFGILAASHRPWKNRTWPISH